MKSVFYVFLAWCILCVSACGFKGNLKKPSQITAENAKKERSAE